MVVNLGPCGFGTNDIFIAVRFCLKCTRVSENAVFC